MSPSLTSERDREVLRSFARRIDPSDAGAHNNLGVLYYNKGLYEEAVSAFMRALELDQKMQVAQRNLEIAYFNTGYYDKRVAELTERLRARPDDRETRWELGRTHALLNQTADAVAEFTELLRYHPSDIPSLVQLGLAERTNGDLDRALGYLERALTRAPSRRGAEPAQSRRVLPDGLRAGRHGPARRGARGDEAGDPAQPDAVARAGEPGHRAGARRRHRERPSRSPREPRGADGGARRGAVGALQSRSRLPTEGLLRRGAARVWQGARARRGSPARAASDGRGTPAAPRGEGGGGPIRRAAGAAAGQSQAVERARRRAAPGRKLRRGGGVVSASGAGGAGLRSRAQQPRRRAVPPRQHRGGDRRVPGGARRTADVHQGAAQPRAAAEQGKALPARARGLSHGAADGAGRSRGVERRGTRALRAPQARGRTQCVRE